MIPSGCADAVFKPEMLPLTDGRLHFIPDPLTVLRMNKIVVFDFPAGELPGFVPSQGAGPGTGKLHGPALVVKTPVSHTRQIVHENGDTLLMCVQRIFGLFALGDVTGDKMPTSDTLTF